MLQHLYPRASYVTLDRFDVLESAQDDPEGFLEAQIEPVIIDEVQYAPGLFRHIRIVSDSQKGTKERFSLTGSQRYAVIQGVNESLAGRAGIIEMLGLSFREARKDSLTLPFSPTKDFRYRIKRLNLYHRSGSKIDVLTEDVYPIVRG